MKIEIAPKNVKIEIPDYGEFFVIPLGAGAEAEMRIVSRKIGELTEDTKQYADIVEREKNGEEFDKNSEEYKKALESYRKLALAYDELRDTTLEKMRGCFKGKNIEKLFNDFTYEQILEIHGKAMSENG